MKCDVYWNLHEHLFSVRDRATGRVARHMRHMSLKNVTFVVQAAGQQKVRETKRKQVHAYLRGQLGGRRFEWERAFPVSYDPYKHDTFVALVEEHGLLVQRYIVAAPHVRCCTLDGHPQVIAYDATLGDELPL